jgi:hypothetical protein
MKDYPGIILIFGLFFPSGKLRNVNFSKRPVEVVMMAQEPTTTHSHHRLPILCN